MNYKILILIALIASVLLSGCIDDRNLQVGVKYPILKMTFNDHDNYGDSTVYYLDNNSVNVVPVHIVKEQDAVRGSYYTRGKIVLDNESYLKIIWIERRDKYDVGSYDSFYSEIHLTNEDVKKFI